MAHETSYIHRSGKQISFVWSDKTPRHVYEIWKFFDAHPEALDMDDEDVQEMDGMWYRKASLLEARCQGPPANNHVPYPTENECVMRTVAVLRQQTRFDISRPLDLQDLQNSISGLCFRKKITRQAIAILREELRNTKTQAAVPPTIALNPGSESPATLAAPVCAPIRPSPTLDASTNNTAPKPKKTRTANRRARRKIARAASQLKTK